MGLIGQEYTDNTTGQVYMKGGNSRELGWFPIGTATGNATVLYGTAGQASPAGLVASAGPAIWYGTNGTIWVKTSPGNDTSNWHSVLVPEGFDAWRYFGSGAIDPYFGGIAYQMNNPERDGGVTRLTWTIPAPFPEFYIQTIAIATVDIYYSSTGNDIHTANKVPFPMYAPYKLAVPSNGYVWGVVTAYGTPLVYTQAELDVIRNNGTLISGSMFMVSNVAVPIGNGTEVTFSAIP